MEALPLRSSFVMACSKFFGRKPDQTLLEFSTELKALTPEDRSDMALMFAQLGVEITDVPIVTVK